MGDSVRAGSFLFWVFVRIRSNSLNSLIESCDLVKNDLFLCGKWYNRVI